MISFYMLRIVVKMSKRKKYIKLKFQTMINYCMKFRAPIIFAIELL